MWSRRAYFSAALKALFSWYWHPSKGGAGRAVRIIQGMLPPRRKGQGCREDCLSAWREFRSAGVFAWVMADSNSSSGSARFAGTLVQLIKASLVYLNRTLAYRYLRSAREKGLTKM